QPLRAGARGFRETPLPGVAFVGEPLGLLAPVHLLVRLPDVGTAAAEAERLEAHRLQRDVAREDHQVGPGDLLAVLLLDRPEQAARLVQAHVVRPAVERREALLAPAAAPAPGAGAVRAGAVPGHADEQRPVVAEVGRPPVLRVGHQRGEVLLQGCVVEALERRRVVEVLTHRVRPRGMLVEQVEAQLVRPPVAVRRTADGGMVERGVSFGGLAAHGRLLSFDVRRDSGGGPLIGPTTYLGYNDRVSRLTVTAAD